MTQTPTPDLSPAAPPPVAAAPAPTGAPAFTIQAMLTLRRRAGRKGD
ncbi:hypothetical protein [Nitrospirillum amazonense]|uniref:Uncharacterized protein n=1 Tax=Nitrospirillum amazonense TaxID=28077 RepID=A0A560K3A7_9PROT|nr:hypothetical protein [Nitrospirillum amazonense]MDG3444247.1 hypothetical protein [Nitrospirillum amazonense]TWB77801.1 hypothetical protein FBZ87_103620 [Nitrospirillum amazonense]